MTIFNRDDELVQEASAVALNALGWVLADEKRADRFIDLTGLTPDILRGAIGEVSTHRAVIEFLCAYEPDLIGAAEALEMAPEKLAQIKDILS